jgi:uncharacterized protein with NAD-binding domain and iron-sulfur cluster
MKIGTALKMNALRSFLLLLSLACFHDCPLATAFLGPSVLSHRSNANANTNTNKYRSLKDSSSFRSDAFTTTTGTTSANKTVVVIGGGWAGFSAADALTTANGDNGVGNVNVHLLDASPRGPGGLAGGWRTPVLNRPVEAGLHGFWREYRNTFAAIERIGLDLDNVLTPFQPSVLYSESGRVALAPVLGSSDNDDSDTATDMGNANKLSLQNMDWMNPSKTLRPLAELLPPPLDIALLSEFSPDSPLSVADRVSAIGLLGAWADFEQEDSASWARYDSVSAESLFLATAGVSTTLYQELVSPLLHVLPMTPGYDCSAAAALSCFHVFALQAAGAFDVRWCRGTISERIFNPWAKLLQSTGRVKIQGSAKVTSVEQVSDHESKSDQKFIVSINNGEKIECDAVVFAVGITAAQRLLAACPPLAAVPQTKSWSALRAVTCVAVRLFFRPSGLSLLPPGVSEAMQDSPVAVCGARIGDIPQLAETGFCIYDLQRLQDEFSVTTNSTCAALEVDFFRADEIANMESDSQVAELALRAVAAALKIEPIDPDLVVDVSVVRARNAVSHFCVGSASGSPSVKLTRGLYMCGDWIDRTGHASWSTEKAVVTGRQAASAIATDFGLECDASVIPAAPDTVQLSSLRKVARLVRGILPTRVLPRAPWV